MLCLGVFFSLSEINPLVFVKIWVSYKSAYTEYKQGISSTSQKMTPYLF